MVSSFTKSFRLDHIELLCKVLVCEPNNLLIYIKNENKVLTADHPINNPKRKETKADIRKNWATLPLKKQNEISKQIHENLNDYLLIEAVIKKLAFLLKINFVF